MKEQYESQPMNIGEKIWSDFCKQIKKIFSRNMCIYPSEMDIDSLKKIQSKKNIDFSNKDEDKNITAYENVKDIVGRNYYTLYKPHYWKLKIDESNKISFGREAGEDFEKYIKKNKLKDVLKILTKFRKFDSAISDPNSNLDNSEADDPSFILENLDNPTILAVELNKIKSSLEERNDLIAPEASKSKKRKKYLRVALNLYSTLKQIEFQAKLFESAQGDNKEDNDYIIERERRGGFIWNLLRKIGIGGKHYQEISEKNGSNEFNLGELFKRSKIYRRMIREYIDSDDGNKKMSSIQRKLFRIEVLLTKWVNLYAFQPTRSDERLHLSKTLYDQINNLLKFKEVNIKTKAKDLKGNIIDDKTFPRNLDNIKLFLENWKEIRYTKKINNKLKNFNLSKLINKGLEILDVFY